MLILAGVTLNIALSDNGLFSKTKEAADKYKQAQSDEEDEIEKIEYASEGIYITEIEEISTAEEFREISQKVSEGTSFEGTLIKLTSDINLEGEDWTPIGNEENPFKGVFDGKGYKITNLTINTESEYQGLFGYNAGTIQNVGIESGTLTVGPESGGIAGCNTGTIENCYNKANIICKNCTDKGIGGIVGGGGPTSKISKCFNSGDITVNGIDTDTGYYPGVGGILGQGLSIPNYDIIEFCYNSGVIDFTCTSGTYATAAGISANDSSRINSCYNTGSVTINSGESKIINVLGGIKAFSRDGGSVDNCYNIGEIKGLGGDSSNVGGIVGWTNGGDIKNCLWTMPDKENYWGGKNPNVTGDTVSNKKESDSTKNEWIGTLGSNFINDSNNKNGGYPILFWQK